MLPTVRAVSLANYIEVARFVGLDPYAMLRRARIAPDALDDPETRLPAKAYGDLLAASAAESGRASIGLLMAECRTFASLGPISLLLEHQPDVRAMVEAMIRFVRHFNDILIMSLEDDGITATIRCDIVAGIANPQAIEYAVTIWYRSLGEVYREGWYPQAIHFTHAAPADLADYRRVLPCPVVFDADFNGLTCRSAVLDVPNARVDAAMAQYAEQLLGMVQLENVQSSVAQRARRAIGLLMPDGQASVEQVAGNLGVHPRRLQRLLEREGESFASLVNEVRRACVLRSLGSSRHSIAAISALAGYSTQSAFTRWFAREFGEPPAAWRSGRQRDAAAHAGAGAA